MRIGSSIKINRAVPVHGRVEAARVLGIILADAFARVGRVIFVAVTLPCSIQVVVVIDGPSDVGNLLRLGSDIEHLVGMAVVGLADSSTASD